MKRTLFILLFFSTQLIAQDRRLALVIGNAAYTNSGTLKNPVNDAKLMASTLEGLHFEVIIHTDADKSKMERAIYEFSKQLNQYDVALFYYAGHGVQVDGTNYLIPIDAKIDDKIGAQFEAIDLNRIVGQFEAHQNNTNIVILDACRNDPFKTWSRGSSRGFKAVSAPSGTIIAYATSEGATAADGDGNNGLYTKVLVEEMHVNQRIEDVFIETRNKVRKISGNTQSPQEWSQLTGKFYFNESLSVSPSPTLSASTTPSTTLIAHTERNLDSNLSLPELIEKGTSPLVLLENGYTPNALLQAGLVTSDFIGLEYKEGIIFEIDREDNKVWIAAKQDQNRGIGLDWENAKKVANRPVDGTLGWSLPNQTLLKAMYQNLKKNGLGNFENSSYWSSSESSYSNAWGISFSSGGRYDFNKTSKKKIRAVKQL
ncbi:hypothetical protein BFP72_15065 [Reichenbachiella sp. 5M10]|uniref:caspase family protein n=1 Tax=Reichenbachiella sp. 5M10 TaxID=1889772 RepID=UPI000C61A09C|nr:caspase family protein [Reichenbachiella sp. 5M10]PIB36625.1 hypothetical protein BFP72_15065 [Reichenbachiella sp. 5M10]